jgi:hypothetical protein
VRNQKANTERLPVTISRASRAYLEALVQTGLHGTSVTDIAKAFIEKGIRDAIQAGEIKIKSPEEIARLIDAG